ncbi:MAG: ATP-binding protein [Anaerolineales bacterium]
MTKRQKTPTGSLRQVSCPQCQHPLPSDAKLCPNCGVDLALIALLAERAYAQGIPEAAPIDAPPEILVPRIGELLIEQGLITQSQLDSALAQQRKHTKTGQRRLLGKTLIKMGLIDRETLDGVINRQIFALHAALQEANRTLERRVQERTTELRNALERLAELNQLKANLISNVSHELRTPLAHIRGYVELMADSQLGPLSAEQQNAMKVVVRSINRLEQLIGDLIEFSTASREGLQIELQLVSIPELVTGILERSAEKAKKASVNLVREVSADLPRLRADPDRLGWALFQLVDNGIKFTPPGGTVTVRAVSENAIVTLAVQDTGIGIPSDRMAEVFEPLHQLDGSATRRYGGTGLGLALVRMVLSAHGVEIHAESESGKGSTFWFSMPSAEEG